MFEKDCKKLEFILEKIADLESYKDRYDSIESLLNDKMGWDASVMCIQQIGETLQHKLSDQLKEKHGEHLPIKEAYWTRNYIAHDYEMWISRSSKPS